MVLRTAILFCFLLLVTLATSAKIPPMKEHPQSSSIEKNAYLDFIPYSNEVFFDDSLDQLDDFQVSEEIPEKNSENLLEYLLYIIIAEKQHPDGQDSEDPIKELIISEMHPVTTTTKPPQPSTTEVDTTTTPATENPLSGLCKSLGNGNQGNYLNPLDCKTFINCFNGIAHILTCPTTLIYNVEWNWCDFTRKANNMPACN